MGSSRAARRAGQMPKNSPTSGAEPEGHGDGRRRDQGVPLHDLRTSTIAAPTPSRMPIDSAQQAERQRLDQELHQDVAPGGAERLADADLAGALGDRHQHDVHDPDAADQQAHRGDAGEQAGEHLGGLLLGGQDVLLVADREVVLSAGPDLVLPPEHPLQIHHALLDRHAVLAPGSRWSGAGRCRTPGTRGLERDQDLLVGILEPARGALLAQHADDLERNAADQDGLVDHRRPDCRPASGHRRAEHRIALPRLVFARR